HRHRPHPPAGCDRRRPRGRRRGSGRRLDRLHRAGGAASDRRRVGSDPARVCLPAALVGPALLLAPGNPVPLRPAHPNATAIELKLGVVTSLIGVPFFLAMIFRERRLLEGEPSSARSRQSLKPPTWWSGSAATSWSTAPRSSSGPAS